MHLTPDVKFIISRLREYGYRADIVGGPVRDFLRGVSPDDYDITTEATPEKIKEIFVDKRTIDTGIKHGTVTLVLEGGQYEITTYRLDGEYKDSRHPESVTFTTSLAEDLARRDFTMNAIAYNDIDGITDLFGGEEDIKAGLIRAVGDPVRRFTEDALRILRALRFSSRLGFKIEDMTRKALFGSAHLLKKISAERIFAEWKKLIAGDFAYEVIDEYREIICLFLPEISGAAMPDKDRFCEAAPSIRQLSLFYLACGELAPCAFDTAMRRLKSDTNTRALGVSALSAVGKFNKNSSTEIGYMLMSLGRECAECVTELEILLGLSADSSRDMLSKYLAEGLPYRISDLAVDGKDITALGFLGKAVGEALATLIREVVCGDVANERSALIGRVRALKSNAEKNI